MEDKTKVFMGFSMLPIVFFNKSRIFEQLTAARAV